MRLQTKPFTRSAGGTQVGETHYSVRVVGYQYGQVAVIQHVQLVRDGDVERQEVNTEEGREEIKACLLKLYVGGELPASEYNWLCSLIDTTEG